MAPSSKSQLAASRARGQAQAIEPRSHDDVDEGQHDPGDVSEAEEAAREVVVAQQGGGHRDQRLERVERHPEPSRESGGQEDEAAFDVARPGQSDPGCAHATLRRHHYCLGNFARNSLTTSWARLANTVRQAPMV